MSTTLTQTLLFLTRVRLRAIFFCDRAFLWNLARFVLLLFVLAAGWFYGYLYDAVMNNPEITWRMSRMDAGIHAIGVSVVILLNYVPSFRPRSAYLHAVYPVSERFRTVVNLYGDQLTILYGYVIIFIAMMIVGGSSFNLWSGLNALLFLAAIIVTERCVKVVIEKHIPQLPLYLAGIALFAGSLLYYLAIGIPEHLEAYRQPIQSLWLGSTFFAATLFYFYLSAAAGETRSRRVTEERAKKQFTGTVSFILTLYLRRKATVVTLFMLVVSKLLMGAYGYVMLSSRQDEFSGMMEYYILTLLLPIIPFSYVHNNFAGFFRESWVQFILMSGQRRLLFRVWMGSLLPILVLDIFLAFSILGILGLLSPLTFVYYALSVSLFIPLGMISSLHHPRYVERFFTVRNMANFRNNSSGLYLLLFFALALLLALAMYAEMLLYLIIPVLLLSTYLLFLISRFYEKKRYDLYLRLYEE
ncbi:MAG: putative inner membrane protein [Bacteroidetes bacterium HLUCCA01]|nr:MAG: putative inner membrane protein [Bacteroidetes bacterium HLUCCA01]